MEIIYEEKSERDKFAIVYHNLSFFYNKIIFITQKIKQTRLTVFLFIKQYFEVATAYGIDTSMNNPDVTCNIIFHNAIEELAVTSKLVLYIKNIFFLEPNNKINFVQIKLMK